MIQMHRWKTFAAILICLPIFAACTTLPKACPDPGVITITETQFVPIPADLLIEHSPVTLPDVLTWGEVVQFHILDRATIEALNGQLRAIATLEQPLPE